MPDITMCSNYRCPLRWDCARSSASGTKPNKHRQSYSGFPFRYRDDDTLDAICDYEIPLDPNRNEPGYKP